MSAEHDDALQLYKAKLAELQAFEAAPPNGWNFLGSPTWQRWLQLKEEAAAAEAAYYGRLSMQRPDAGPSGAT